MSKKKYYVRPDGLHESIRTVHGKRVAFRGKSDREVDKKILEYKETAAKGRKIKEIADEWEREHESEISEGTALAYSKEVKRIKKAFGDFCASEVTPQMLQKDLYQFSKTHKRSSVQQAKTVLGMVFQHAVISGDIATNPAADLLIPRGTEKGRSRQALTEEQERAVIAWESRRNSDNVSLWYFLLFSGLRRGEALALQYSDIDRKENVIHVTKKVNFTNPQHPTVDDFLKSKNGKRDVPLFRPLADRIPKNRIGLMFPGKSGGLMTAGEFRNNWIHFCREVGFSKTIKNSDGSTTETFAMTPHALRHSFATICYEAGADPRQAAQMLGDTPQVTEEIYTHLRTAKQKIAWEKMDAFISEKVDSGS